MTSAVDEIVNFIASENPTRVLDFKASEATKKRVFDLIERSKKEELSEKEQVEPDQKGYEGPLKKQNIIAAKK